MKIKPIETNNEESLMDVRYNKNINIKYASITSSIGSVDKRNYGAINLLSLMYESSLVDPKNIKESFKKSQEYVNEYEGKN